MNPTLVILLFVALLAVAGIWIWQLTQKKRRAEDALRERGSGLLQKEDALRQSQSALEASEARRAALLESALDCVISLNHAGRITEFNAAAEKTFGHASAEVQGKPLADFINPTVFGKVDSDSFMNFFTADGGRMLGKRQEMTALRAGGAEFPIELVLTRVRKSDPPAYTGYFREITERIKGETAMFERASLAALNVEINRALGGTDGLRTTLQRCSEVLVWHVDVAQTRIWTLADGGASLELQGSAGIETGLEGPQSRPPLNNTYIGRLTRQGRPFLTNSVVVENFDPNEREWIVSQRIVSFALYPLLAEDRVVGVLALYDRKPLLDGLITNISAIADGITQFIERTRAESHVREQAALLDEATDAIMVRELNGQIRFWSRGAEKIFGWSATEAAGRNANQLLTESATPAVQAAQAVTLAKGKWSGEFSLRARDGREVVVESRWTLLRDEDGRPKSILAIATDITEKKQLEKKFLRTQRLEVVGTLAGGIAHDLNNLLGPILIVSQLLRKKLTDEKSNNWLSLMQSNAMRGAGLVKQILGFARGMAGEQGVLQLHHLISDIERMAQETFPSSIVIEVDAPRNLWPVQGDATQLHQVLLNLCVNARDAMPHGGHLKIEAQNFELNTEAAAAQPGRKPGRYVAVSVSDTGTGIPPELQKKIFEPFFTTKQPGEGTGLGLSTVKSIVTTHGGHIELESTVGKGTAFKVYFPAADAAEIKVIEASPAEQLVGGEKVLLVDDEPAIRELAKATLEDYGYSVVSASDGAEGVALFAQHRGEVEAVIIDVSMPVMDGPSAIHVLRKIDPGIKLVVVSGGPVDEQILRLEKLPSTVFLPKPYSADQILRALRKVLDTVG